MYIAQEHNTTVAGFEPLERDTLSKERMLDLSFLQSTLKKSYKRPPHIFSSSSESKI